VQFAPPSRQAADPATFSVADSELEDTLDNLDGAQNYARWIFAFLEPYLGWDILEVGAGHGTFTELLARRDARVVATDLSERCTAVLRQRFSAKSNVEILRGDTSVSARRGPFDTAILINVLEHIEDDDLALQHLRDSLKPGGRLALWVPAFQGLYADFDRRVGHFRRYQRSGLGAQLVRAGFTVVDIRYANAIGAMIWWVVARQLGATPTGRHSVGAFDRYLIPIIRRLESRRPPPFGQSVFAVAARPLESSPHTPLSLATARP
jgi:SAM-dependent methyltransferase